MNSVSAAVLCRTIQMLYAVAVASFDTRPGNEVPPYSAVHTEPTGQKNPIRHTSIYSRKRRWRSRDHTWRNLIRSSASVNTSMRRRYPITRRHAGSWTLVRSWWISWDNMRLVLPRTSDTMFYANNRSTSTNDRPAKISTVVYGTSNKYVMINRQMLIGHKETICLSKLDQCWWLVWGLSNSDKTLVLAEEKMTKYTFHSTTLKFTQRPTWPADQPAHLASARLLIIIIYYYTDNHRG